MAEELEIAPIAAVRLIEIERFGERLVGCSECIDGRANAESVSVAT
jgi:hypothetical protein